MTGSHPVGHFLHPSNRKVMARKRAETPQEEEGEEKEVLVVSVTNSPAWLVLRRHTTETEVMTSLLQ
jgi:hypothetical protein